MAAPLPGLPRRLGRAEVKASLHRALERWNGASPVWVFGYGSLIWKPELVYDRRLTARVHGYHRRLCLWSRVNRGTPECPGLVAGLDRGGSCAGVVYRVPPHEVRRQFERLWEREMFMGSYAPRWLHCRAADGTSVSALAFVVRRDVPNYAGRLSEAEILDVFRRGSRDVRHCRKKSVQVERVPDVMRSRRATRHHGQQVAGQPASKPAHGAGASARSAASRRPRPPITS
jgi:cation transport protein ChaC